MKLSFFNSAAAKRLKDFFSRSIIDIMWRKRFVFRIVLLAVILTAAMTLWLKARSVSPQGAPILYTVARSDYSHHLTVSGDVESSVSVEIKAEVAPFHNWRPKIEWVIPDGSFVRAGDILMRIDASELEERLILHEIQLLGHEANLRGYETELASLEYQRRAYVNGDLEIDRLEKKSNLYQAREKEKEQRRNLDQTLRLFDLGYVSDRQLEAELVALKKANNALELEILKSDLLERFVSKLKLLDIDMKIYAARVKLSSMNKTIAHRNERITFFKENIEKSVIRAPRDGMAVHVVPSNRGWENQYLTVGTELYKDQVVLKLPSAEKTQVAVSIEEENLTESKVGTRARITFDALEGVSADGFLESVRPFAENEEWMHRPGRRFSAVVAFDPESVRPLARRLKPGLTASVELLIDERKNAIQVPEHAVLKIEGQPHVLVWKNAEAIPRPIKTLAENDRFAVIADGLTEGEQVVCGAESFWDKRE